MKINICARKSLEVIGKSVALILCVCVLGTLHVGTHAVSLNFVYSVYMPMMNWLM